MHHGPTLSKALLAVLLLGGCLMAWRMGGNEPRLWNDTVGDQRIVRECLHEERCAFQGIHASVPGVHVGGGWTLARTFLEFTGLSTTQVHLGMNLLEAATVPLAALAGWELAGTPAALLSALAVGLTLRATSVEHDVLYNSRPVAFLGALFVLLALQAVRRQRTLLLALAAATAATAANLHPVNGLLGVSVVGAGLLFPGRRLRATLLAGLVFGAVLFLGAPWMWLENAQLVLGGWRADPMTGPSVESALTPILLPWLAASLGLTAVIGIRAAPGSRDRRAAVTLLATLLPMALVFLVSTASHRVPLSDKYLVGLAAPVAAGIGLGAAAAWAWLSDRVGPRLPAIARRVASSDAVIRLTPWAIAATVALLPVPAVPGYDGGYRGRAELTLPDVEALAGLLRTRGLDDGRAFRGLGHPAVGDILGAMAVLAPLPTLPSTAEDDGIRLLVLKVPEARVPTPLPAGWTIVRSRHGMALLLAEVAGWIDWRTLEICPPQDSPGSVEPGPCRPQPFLADPASPHPVPAGMPDLPQGRNATLTLRLPLRLPPAPAVHEVRIPRIPGFCPGRVIEVRGGRATIAPGGAGARIAAVEPAASDGSLTMSWTIDGEAGQTCFYDRFPPFFLDGEPAVLDDIESLLRQPTKAVAEVG